MATPPAGFEDALSLFGPVLFDPYCQEPIAWGFEIRKYLGEIRFKELRTHGELVCVHERRWVLVMESLTTDAARAKYGAPTAEERGPQGGFRSITYGTKQFIDRRMRPKDWGAKK